MSSNPHNPTRYDASDFLEVYEHAPHDECDRWVVYIGNDCFTMSDNADQPNGFNQYAGTTGDLFRAMVEGWPVADLSTLPRGTRWAILDRLWDNQRPIPDSLQPDVQLIAKLRDNEAQPEPVSQAVSQDISLPQISVPGYPSPFTHVRPVTKRPGEGWLPFGDPRPASTFILKSPQDSVIVVEAQPDGALILCNRWQSAAMPAPSFHYYVTIPTTDEKRPA